jgi:caa(3)-type oxidase subunit IV
MATVFVAQYDFGELNVVIALLIAGTKAALVMGVFMHLAYDSKFFAVVISTAFAFLALFVLFPMADLDSRADLDREQKNFLPRDERIYKEHLEHPDALPLRPGLQQADPKKLIFGGPGKH